MPEITLTVNGMTRTLFVEPRELLIDTLRERLQLRGTKRGCNTSNCGACKVLVDGVSKKSCSTLTVKCDGQSVLTIEGVADGETLDPIQQAFIDAGAVQCGFCTPGMVIEAKSLLDRSPEPSVTEITEAFADNLCRCTGYKKIIEAVQRAAVYRRRGSAAADASHAEPSVRLAASDSMAKMRYCSASEGDTSCDVHFESVPQGDSTGRAHAGAGETLPGENAPAAGTFGDGKPLPPTPPADASDVMAKMRYCSASEGDTSCDVHFDSVPQGDSTGKDDAGAGPLSLAAAIEPTPEVSEDVTETMTAPLPQGPAASESMAKMRYCSASQGDTSCDVTLSVPMTETETAVEADEAVFEPETEDTPGRDYVGRPVPIRDARAKVTGTLRYTGDLEFPGMLHAKVLWSPHAHARIVSIDTSEAEKMPGVRAVATHLNTPDTFYNSALRFYEHTIPKTEQIFPPIVRYVGDRVAAVAAETPAQAEAAVKAIKVEYEVLEPILTIDAALDEKNAPLHGDSNVVVTMRSEAGDVDAAMAAADHVFEGVYESPPVHQGAIEPHAAIADYDYEGRLSCFSTSQNTFAFRIILGQIFNLPLSRVRMVRPPLGGAFGSKLEMTIEPVACALSMLTMRPVRLELTRSETIVSTRTRHGARVRLKTAVTKEGKIVAQDFDIVTNTGAYTSSAFNVLGALSHKIYKLYKTPNMRFRGRAVYTNTPVAGAMRGYGSPQIFFGQQLQLREIAEALDIDLVQLQLQNAVEPDDLDVLSSKPLLNPRLADCIRLGAEKFDWEKRKFRAKLTRSANRDWAEGVGMAVGAHGNGVFGAHRDCITLMLRLNEDGSFTYFTGTHDMGNGSVTVQVQVLADKLGVTMDKIRPIEADTDAVQWNLGDYASRGVYVEAACARNAADSMLEKIFARAARMLETDPARLDLRDGRVTDRTDPALSVSLSDVAVREQQENFRDLTVVESYSSPAGETSYGAHFARVFVNRKTHEVQVRDYVAVHDVGRVLNGMSLEGQLEGAILMGIGAALFEDLSADAETGKTANNFRKYRMPRMSDMPKMDVAFVEEGSLYGPYGAKSIGEVSIVPSTPAVANAVADALKCTIRKVPVSAALAEWNDAEKAAEAKEK